ncbi:hypothetical protein Bhyg_05776, partial [Pseudolycoriella hygida]
MATAVYGGSPRHHNRIMVSGSVESKPFYVKSETVLDRQQQLNYRSDCAIVMNTNAVNSTSILKIKKPIHSTKNVHFAIFFKIKNGYKSTKLECLIDSFNFFFRTNSLTFNILNSSRESERVIFFLYTSKWFFSFGIILIELL